MNNNNSASFKRYAKFKPGKFHQKIAYVAKTTKPSVYIASNLYMDYPGIALKHVNSIIMNSISSWLPDSQQVGV